MAGTAAALQAAIEAAKMVVVEIWWRWRSGTVV
jgi:hypothetical protein